MGKKLFILELNEFNHKLLKYYSKKYNLNNLNKVLKFKTTKTYTSDRYIGDNNQFGYLDPWSQWVSIHTQKKAKIHKIKNLGDVPSLKYKQVWEKRSEDFYIWGPMNASKNKAKNVKVFFPDPWVYSENAFPSGLNKILKPIKLITKSRGLMDKKKKIKLLLELARNIILIGGSITFLNFLFDLLKGYMKFGNKNLIQIIAWENLAFKIFLKFFEKKDKFISIYFLNSLAHVQHHYWKFKKDSEEIIYCLNNIDLIIKKILEIKDVELIIYNGLSQTNAEKDKLYLYEQVSHESFLNSFNIKFKKVEKLMTNDAHIFFKNYKDAKDCYNILSSIKFKSRNIFFVEIKKNKIFYKTNYIYKANDQDKLVYKNLELTFLKYFRLITLRRGIHSHNGEILSQLKYFPKKIPNHYFFNYI